MPAEEKKQKSVQKVSQNERNSSAKASGTSPARVPAQKPQVCPILEDNNSEALRAYFETGSINLKTSLKYRKG
ncbi:hypothetical protein EO93_18090 [Methanosarcina sp. 1.H.A.2.2]|nr:hypothetical protein EO93_18090 [Methanosarcina sp. 1.H.A.2.2]